MRKQIIHIRLLPLLFAASGFLVSCGESLEDRAAREAKEFTEKFCPTPVQNDESTDSLTFDKHTKTYTYYRTLSGPADNAPVINANRTKLVATLLEALKTIPVPRNIRKPTLISTLCIVPNQMETSCLKRLWEIKTINDLVSYNKAAPLSA